jgi:hypothetical protein
MERLSAVRLVMLISLCNASQEADVVFPKLETDRPKYAKISASAYRKVKQVGIKSLALIGAFVFKLDG